LKLRRAGGGEGSRATAQDRGSPDIHSQKLIGGSDASQINERMYAEASKSREDRKSRGLERFRLQTYENLGRHNQKSGAPRKGEI